MVWRMIYNTTEVLDLFETEDITITIHNIFESSTQTECFDKIDELKLVYYYPLSEDQLLMFSGGTRNTITINN